jgi:hypothetical protein
MRAAHPQAYAFLCLFKDQLLARKTAPLRQAMQNGPFYPILGIGPHTVSQWKVVFKDLTELFQCCVLGPLDSSMVGKPVLPDCTLRLNPASSEDEAHYIAATLNSSPCRAALYFSSAGVQTQRYHAGDAEKVAVAKYVGSPAQLQLALLSKKCHAAARRGDDDAVKKTEDDIDTIAAQIWSIGGRVLQSIRRIVRRLEASDSLSAEPKKADE